jgi:hypothetical protein
MHRLLNSCTDSWTHAQTLELMYRLLDSCTGSRTHGSMRLSHKHQLHKSVRDLSDSYSPRCFVRCLLSCGVSRALTRICNTGDRLPSIQGNSDLHRVAHDCTHSKLCVISTPSRNSQKRLWRLYCLRVGVLYCLRVGVQVFLQSCAS